MISEKVPVAELYKLELKTWWAFFKGESFAFKMICGYLFVEYVRPQSILPWLDFLPWAQVFVLAALIGLLVDPQKLWVKSPINKWIILFFLSIVWSSFNAYFPHWSYRNLANSYTWFVIYFLIINIVVTPQRLLFFLAIFCIASFKISFSLALIWAKRGFAFTDWGLSGPPGFFQNSGELAIQMLVFWPISLGVVISLRPYVPKWKYKVLTMMPITAIMVILGSSSRGGQLALLAQIIFKFIRQILRFRVIFVVLTFVAIFFAFLPEEQKARFENIGNDKTSQQRLLYWENGFEMMNEHPLTGIGYFNFIPYYEVYYPGDMLYQNAELAHNIFIQVGADLGWIGLVIYVFLILSSFRVLKKILKSDERPEILNLRKIASFMNTSMIGFLIAGQFVSVVYYPFLWILLAICSCFFNISYQKK